MRRRVRGSRGAKRRWGPHISSPWPKGGENKGNEVTVLTACGIETTTLRPLHKSWSFWLVATVLTACGIETCQTQYKLFQVLDLVVTVPTACGIETNTLDDQHYCLLDVATVPTACGIETHQNQGKDFHNPYRCNSAYRLRYATKGARQQRSKATMRSAHL